jgi:hypothetical protein
VTRVGSLVLAGALAACGAGPAGSRPGPVAPDRAGLHVSGDRILDRQGVPARLLGVNRSGTEYACIQGNGFFDGPSDDASIAAILSWNANSVRLPLNEDCWLAINGAPPAYSGAPYQRAVADFVARLLARGIHPILELHWSAPGLTKATEQSPMPDRDHSIAFWSQVATRFGEDGDVVFELFNEPFPDANQDTAAAWTCWRDGGTCAGIGYEVAGMQELVTAVRAAGARNLLLLGGVRYANALSQWLAYAPRDPEHNVAAAWHAYDFNACSTVACYDEQAGKLAGRVPVVATEIGEQDCAGGFITTLMGWLDSRGQSYLGWKWDPSGGCLALVADYAGRPAGAYGETFRARLLSTPH